VLVSKGVTLPGAPAVPEVPEPPASYSIAAILAGQLLSGLLFKSVEKSESSTFASSTERSYKKPVVDAEASFLRSTILDDRVIESSILGKAAKVVDIVPTVLQIVTVMVPVFPEGLRLPSLHVVPYRHSKLKVIVPSTLKSILYYAFAPPFPFKDTAEVGAPFKV
jgi:hypothetical protein